MSGNPLTDQYAAQVRDRRDVTADSFVLAVADQFAEAINTYIPELPHANIGEVLLHAGAGIGGIAIQLHQQGASDGEIISTICNILAVAGGKLYSPGEELPPIA